MTTVTSLKQHSNTSESKYLIFEDRKRRFLLCKSLDEKLGYKENKIKHFLKQLSHTEWYQLSLKAERAHCSGLLAGTAPKAARYEIFGIVVDFQPLLIQSCASVWTLSRHRVKTAASYDCLLFGIFSTQLTIY